ncbi:hypothetical protein [Streptomyces sp. NBC_01320]|uniref:hypothetical protein n=1 Tax=Streptomyces sp. NBC_01320 TaxID=2903824 RepID=UPI002E0E8649|nr:hypothetical protein OG395_47210 [Streptomyces sp. NBC_01320]
MATGNTDFGVMTAAARTSRDREIPDPPTDGEPADEGTDTSLAKVIPLGLFDPGLGARRLRNVTSGLWRDAVSSVP